MQMSEKLFSLRQKSGQSLQELADAIEVSKAHVWDLEKGRSKNPSFELVQKLAKHYNVSIDVLTGSADEPDEAEMQVERINRGLEELSDRDRIAVEALINSMKNSNAG